MTRLVALTLIAASLITLSGCGRRGALEAPSAIGNAPKEAAAPDAPKEDKPFVLDGLIK
jgi:predicted small lipoprotein YifL